MQTNVENTLIPEKISNFIKLNKLATVGCVTENAVPYCFNCFYAFDEQTQLLFFKSSASSYHSTLLSKNTAVAGTILANKIEWLSLKGIQFTGKVLDNSFPHPVKPQTYYHKVFPLAVAKPGDVWCIKLEMIKMTDNSQVFGKKLEWHKREQ